jgi:hypothetical protein
VGHRAWSEGSQEGMSARYLGRLNPHWADIWAERESLTCFNCGDGNSKSGEPPRFDQEASRSNSGCWGIWTPAGRNWAPGLGSKALWLRPNNGAY